MPDVQGGSAVDDAAQYRRPEQRRLRPVLAMFADDATLRFPGDNTWSQQFREPHSGRQAVPTHRGRDEIEAFLRRYVDHGIQMEIEEILVNGPPWNMRAAAVVHDWIPATRATAMRTARCCSCAASGGRSSPRKTSRIAERVTAYEREYLDEDGRPLAQVLLGRRSTRRV